MGHASLSIHLPRIIEMVQTHKLEGVLVCNHDPRLAIQLFFRQGRLVYINSTQPDQEAETLLHQLLGWQAFELYWQPLTLHLRESNVTAETWQALLDVLPVLVQSGQFRDPAQSQLDPAFFGTSLKKAVSRPAAPVPAVTNPLRTYTEVNLLLPPATPVPQLSERLDQGGITAQLHQLSRAQFTGYAYYRLGGGDWGLALFLEGALTDLIYQRVVKEERLTGSAALQALGELAARPELGQVEARILKAYRGLVAAERSHHNVPANKTNFSNAASALRSARRDGLIMLYLDSLKLHYLFLFENGEQVGLFGPDVNSGHLATLSAPLALPTSDPRACFSVMVAGQINPVVLPSALKATTAISVSLPPALPTLEAPAAPVFDFSDLTATANLVTAGRLSPVATLTLDDNNPYDF